jgi:hypothetical protein
MFLLDFKLNGTKTWPISMSLQVNLDFQHPGHAEQGLILNGKHSGANVIKHFTAASYEQSNKLECLCKKVFDCPHE